MDAAVTMALTMPLKAENPNLLRGPKQRDSRDRNEKACEPCRKAHRPCTDGFPCARCMRMNEPDRCHFQEPKKRGPKFKKNLPSSQPITPPPPPPPPPPAKQERSAEPAMLREVKMDQISIEPVEAEMETEIEVEPCTITPESKASEDAIEELQQELEQLKLKAAENAFILFRMDCVRKIYTEPDPHPNIPVPKEKIPGFGKHLAVLKNFRIVFATWQFTELFRYTPETILNVSIFRIIHPDTMNRMYKEAVREMGYDSMRTPDCIYVRRDRTCFMSDESAMSISHDDASGVICLHEETFKEYPALPSLRYSHKPLRGVEMDDMDESMFDAPITMSWHSMSVASDLISTQLYQDAVDPHLGSHSQPHCNFDSPTVRGVFAQLTSEHDHHALGDLLRPVCEHMDGHCEVDPLGELLRPFFDSPSKY